MFHFLCGVKWLRPVCRLRVASWDLSLVFEGLSGALSELLQTVAETFLTVKVALFLALTSLIRESEICRL